MEDNSTHLLYRSLPISGPINVCDFIPVVTHRRAGKPHPPKFPIIPKIENNVSLFLSVVANGAEGQNLRYSVNTSPTQAITCLEKIDSAQCFLKKVRSAAVLTLNYSEQMAYAKKTVRFLFLNKKSK